MFRAAVSRWWEKNKIYYLRAYPDIWISVLLTGIVYYKISYGGKKSVKDDSSKPSSGHH